MTDNTDMLRDEERITKLIKKIFEDECNLEITMQEIKSLKNKGNQLKKSMEFTQNDLEERVNNVEENMCIKLLVSNYEYQITSIKLIQAM